jgi:AraC-like DNA-binding protein
MPACDLTFDDRSAGLAQAPSLRGVVDSRPLWKCQHLSLVAFSAPAGARLSSLVSACDGTCVIVTLRGHAGHSGEPTSLTADNVTAAMLSSGCEDPTLIAGEAGVGGLVVTISPSGAGAMAPPGRSHAALPEVAGLITEPGDHIDAWLLVAALDRELSDQRGSVEVAARRLAGSLLRAAHRVAGPALAQGAGGPGYQSQIAETRRRIAASVDRSATLRSLADETGWSPWYLSRRFSAEVGLPVHRYLMRARLRAALARVIGSRDPLSQVAAAVGFSSHSHFTSAFRGEFAATPIALRHLVEPAHADDLRRALATGEVVATHGDRRVSASTA